MIRDRLDELEQSGAVETLPSGGKGVRVTLQLPSGFQLLPRGDRRERLKTEFRRILQSVPVLMGTADVETISLWGETVEAVVPVEVYDDVLDQLDRQGVRVDPVVDVQVIPRR